MESSAAVRGSVIVAVDRRVAHAHLPAGVDAMRKQRIGRSGRRLASAAAGVGDVDLSERAGAVGGWTRRPSPLNHTLLPPVAVTTRVAASLPALVRFWMICGATVSEASASQAPLGSPRLTTQFLPVAASAQAGVTVSTSWKRTVVLRASASARASCSPACMRLGRGADLRVLHPDDEVRQRRS